MSLTSNKSKQKSSMILIVLFFAVYLSAQTENITKDETVKYKSNQMFISLSPLIAPRVCLGFIQAKKTNHWSEIQASLHGFYSEGFKNFGLSLSYNYFWGSSKFGYFTFVTAGYDYFELNELFLISANGEGKSAPNLSSGFGYNFRITEKSSLRLSLDIGYKLLLSNFYISYNW